MWRLHFIGVLLFLFCVKSNCEIKLDPTLVTVKNGVLQGEERGTFYAFEGIPYAEPPTGENRFEPPKSLTANWDGIRNATVPGSVCMQYDHFVFEGDKVHGSEDCLFLNIYTQNTRPDEKYPVIFYIHGGAFAFGHSDFYGPRILIQKPLILVTVNYRLGPLGFLSSLDNNLPGNMGLKDQNLALKWVKQNIEHFGGDAEKITIIGYSAGGASVHLHYMSKLSRGLFQNGISHSGVALNPWVMTQKADEKAKQVANALGCPTCCSLEMKTCLKTKPADEIVRAMGMFQPFLYMPFTVFGPVVEPESDTSFITKSPAEYIESGDIEPKPWLVTYTKDEGLYPVGELLRKPEYLPELNRRWLEIAPFLLDYNNTVEPDKLNEASQKIREHYFQDLPIDSNSFNKITNMVSDRLYKVGIHKAIKLQVPKTSSPIYIYYYQFPAKFGVEELMSNSPIDLGVSHGDDVLTLYETVARRPPFGYQDDEIPMQNELLNLYESYLNNRQPKFGESVLEPVHADGHGFNYFDIIDAKTYSQKIYDNFEMDEFWDSVLPYY